jgi:hypothetical protein
MIRRVATFLLVCAMAAPAYAQQPARPAPAAGEGTGPGNRAMMWTGIGMMAGGATLAIMSATALKETTAACIGDFFTAVCGATEDTNKGALWGGLALAGVGGILTVFGVRHAHMPDIAFRPGRVMIGKTLALDHRR